MSIIQIKTPSPEQALPLIQGALEMEKKLTRDSLRISEGRIGALLERLKTTKEQVVAGTALRTEENEQEFLDLEGELELHDKLKETLTHLEQLEVCR